MQSSPLLVRKTPNECPAYETKWNLMWGSNLRDVGNMEDAFITITPSSTLTWSRSIIYI